MRCFGRTRLAGGCARPFAFSFFRAEDLAAVLRAAVLRAGDFFWAGLRLAERDFGFCLAIDVLPLMLRENVSTDRAS
jgi:hypothetical protein